MLVEGFSRLQSEPDVDEMVKNAAEQLAMKTGANLQNVSVPMHLDCKSALLRFWHEITKIQTRKLLILPRFYFPVWYIRATEHYYSYTEISLRLGPWFCD